MTAVLVFACLAALQPQNPPAQPPVQAPKPQAEKPPPQTPPQGQPPAAQPRPAAPARSTMTVMVTDRQGRALQGVQVNAAGPVDRDGTTEADGSVAFRNMNGGVYRLRFEHPEFITLEREVTVQPGRALRTTAALNPAPPPPPPPKPEPEPPPQQPQQQRQPPPGDYKATFVSLPDFVEKNYIGNNPSRTSQVGCSGSATATLIQLRDPLQEHRHNDVDEAVYVVAGEGTQRIGNQDIPLTAGTFTVIPRATSHSFTRKGSRPLIVLSILSGEPCSK